ncbi:ring-cleaving dioxygenase [Bacteroidota bacterium]
MTEPGTHSKTIAGIHHITGICGPAQENLDFYTRFLGLRLVKKTVNFDDPGTYHLYYGDGGGSPGTILTFFPWEHSPAGRAGVGMVTHTAFSIPPAAIDYWVGRFADQGYDFVSPLERLGQVVIGINAPDGLALELVGDPEVESLAGWADGPTEPAHAIRAFHSATLSVRDFDFLQGLFSETFGYSLVVEGGDRIRLAAPGNEIGRHVDLVIDRERVLQRAGRGTIHHIAFRAADEASQMEWRDKLLSAGLRVTEVLDRNYFKSIYFREPGGILFEIATDAPGFAVDEPEDTLGSGLKLPPWLEPRRSEIEKRLVPLT